MHPMVVAAAQHQPLLRPDDLAADREAGGLEALGDRRRMQCAVPDVGDVAGEQRPGLAPVGAVVVQHLSGALGAGGTGLVAPARVVLHPVGRIADHQQRGHPAEHPLDVGRHRGVAAEQPMRSEQPEIARPADRVDRRLRDLVLALAAAVLVAEPGQQPVQLVVVEAGQRRDRSPRPAGRRARARAAPRPTAVFSPVVHQPVGAGLRRGQARGRSPARPSGRAGAPPRRGWPADQHPSSSTTIGRQPNSFSEAATSRPRPRSSAGCGHRGSAARAAVRRRPSAVRDGGGPRPETKREQRRCVSSGSKAGVRLDPER